MKVHQLESQAGTKYAVNRERLYLQNMSVQFGSHMAMRTVMERNMLAGVQRLEGRGSSMHGLKEHMGMYHRLDFDDTLNQPDESPIGDPVHVHARVMKAYGM